MLSLINKKLLTLLVSPSKAATTKLVSTNYATRAPDNDQNMVMDPKEHLDKQGTKHTQSKSGKKAKKGALRSDSGVEGELDVQDRQEGNMIHSSGTENRTPGETYNVGHQSIGQQVGGVYKDRLDYASDEPHGTATPKHDRVVDQAGAEPSGGTVEKTNEDAMEGRTGYGEHVKSSRTGYGEHVAPTGDKQQRHTTAHKNAQHEEPLVTSFHTFTTSFHTWIRARAPHSQQVPKKNQSPPQPTWRPGKSEQNINDDDEDLLINYKGEDKSRDNDDRLLDSGQHNAHRGVLGQDKDDARRHAEEGKPLKGQYERN
jgi:hypothetical protein